VQSIPSGRLDFFQKFAEIFAAQGAPTVSLTPVANLSTVTLVPAVQIALRISYEFSKKFKMTLMFFSGAWGKMIHEQNLKQKIS
jgi:hypothetical protein